MFLAAGLANAQTGPARARPIQGATKKLPMMLIEQKPRTVILEVSVDAAGHVTGTRIVQSSGNGIFDERMRGYWKDTPFMPALDATGRPVADTLRITNAFEVEDRHSMSLKNFRNHSEVEGTPAAENAARVKRMRCRDLLWEFDFMAQRAPRAKLEHEDLFHVSFAMFLAAGTIKESARDALIGAWSTLVPRAVAECRAKPDVLYWQDVFVPLFMNAMPYESAPVP
jgi:TonB family protein